MHNSHDLDLIADYADGSQDPAAQRLVESCAECRAELALHQEIRSFLAGSGPVALTDDERVAMRAGVQAGIGALAPVVALDARRQSRWLKLGSVAAAVFVTVGVAGVLTQQGGQDSASVEAAEAADVTAEAFALEGGTDTSTASAGIAELEQEERSAEDTSQAEGTILSDSLPVGGSDAASIGIGILTDAGPVTRSELDDQLDALIDLLSNQLVSEQLDTTWFNDREIPAPSCLTSEALPVFGVINATVDGQDVQGFVVFDATTSEYRSDVLMVDGCTPFD